MTVDEGLRVDLARLGAVVPPYSFSPPRRLLPPPPPGLTNRVGGWRRLVGGGQKNHGGYSPTHRRRFVVVRVGVAVPASWVSPAFCIERR